MIEKCFKVAYMSMITQDATDCSKSEIKMLICSDLFLVNVEFLTLNISGNLKIVWQAILIRSLTITLCCFKICLSIYRQDGYKKTL